MYVIMLHDMLHVVNFDSRFLPFAASSDHLGLILLAQTKLNPNNK